MPGLDATRPTLGCSARTTGYVRVGRSTRAWLTFLVKCGKFYLLVVRWEVRRKGKVTHYGEQARQLPKRAGE
jgi:hypothetical protein